MIEDALRAYSAKKQDKPKEIVKSAAEDKTASFATKLTDLSAKIFRQLNSPTAALLTGAGAIGVGAHSYIAGKREEAKATKQRAAVVDHLKKIYPASMHARVEEAYGAVSHVAPTVTLNPLIARTMVEHMIKIPESTLAQKKGLGMGDINQLQAASGIEVSRHKAMQPIDETKKPTLLGLIGEKGKTITDYVSNVRDAGPKPIDPLKKQEYFDRRDEAAQRAKERAEELAVRRDSAKVRADLDKKNIELVELRIQEQKRRNG